MKTIQVLARLYFLGEIRRQVHLVTLFLAVILLMLPAYINTFSLGINAFERVAKDFGLTLISFYGVGMALLLGSSAISRDTESKAIFPILARPVTRFQYVTAHLASITLLLALSLGLLGLCLTVSVSALTKVWDFDCLIATGGYILMSLVLTSACLFFSTFASPPLAGVLGAFIYLVGGLSNAFIRFFLVEDRGSQLNAGLARFFKGFLPNFEVFRLKDPMVHNIDLPLGYLPAVSLYGLAWALFFMLAANLVFERKDV